MTIALSLLAVHNNEYQEQYKTQCNNRLQYPITYSKIVCVKRFNICPKWDIYGGIAGQQENHALFRG